MSKTYNYGDKLGYFPTLDEAAPNSIRFNGWFTAASGGSAVTKDKVIDRDYTFHAQWSYGTQTTYTVKFFKHDGTTEITSLRKTVAKGKKLGTLSNNPYTYPGHTFTGWFTSKTGGVLATPTTIVNQNLNLYAQWDT